jgi:hypothetical protein
MRRASRHLLPGQALAHYASPPTWDVRTELRAT